MKKCPFCAEEIQDEAIKCKHCDEFLEERKKTPWYTKTSLLVLAFLTVGPLALPLLWINPQYSRNTKIVVSGIVLLVSYFLIKAIMTMLGTLGQYYEMVL